MFSYIVRRVVYGAVTLLALSFIVFMLLQAAGSPLDRLALNPRLENSFIEEVTRLWGLDQPLLVQYWKWLTNYVQPIDFSPQNVIPWITLAVAAGASIATWKFVERRYRPAYYLGIVLIAAMVALRNMNIEFDWGISFNSGSTKVWDEVFIRAGATFRLGLTALALSLVVGIALGVYQALRQYSFFDQLGTFASFVAFSTPVFVVGVALQTYVAFRFEEWTGVKLFFVAGMTGDNYASLSFMGQMGDILRHLTLPALSIALISFAGYSRFQRASMLEVMRSDYLRTAKAKGLPRRTIIVKHALRNALIPIVTLASINVAFIIGGAIITESIFGWPGLGRKYIEALGVVDFPVIMAIVLVIGIGVVVMNIIADILYGVLDPRVRYE
ncbi:MAG: ABC transporter permease [Acidimicrobiia bacterium]|nr:ABC transporter permease [Acidimicrobiia bacterium]